MMIVAMNDFGEVLPFGQPIAHCNLETEKAIHVIVVTVYFFPVEQAMNIYEIKIETEFIVFFLDDVVLKPIPAKLLAPWCTSSH